MPTCLDSESSSDCVVMDVRRPRNMRVAVTAVGLFAALFIGSNAGPLAGSGKPPLEFRAVSTRSPELLGVTPLGPHSCDPATGRCRLAFLSHDTFDGAISGTAVNAGSLDVDQKTGVGTSLSEATFTGSVAGCGRPGTIGVRWEIELGAQPGRNIGTFEFVSGTGTAGLVTLKGRGNIEATSDPATEITTTTGTLEVDC